MQASLSDVTVRNEGHRRGDGGDAPAANIDFERGAIGGMAGRDITHGDGRADRGREAARGDDADLGIAREDLRAFTRRQFAFDAQADALRGCAVQQLAEDALGTRKAALHLATLRDGEGEVGLDRRRGGGKIVAVERQAGFEAQRIAGAEADRLHLGLREERARDGLRMVRRDRNLESVLTRVARAADPHIDAFDAEGPGAHEDQRRHLAGEPGESVHGLRALQREQRQIGAVDERDGGWQMRHHVGDVAVLGGAVDDDVEMIAAIRGHQVVDDAAVVVEQQRIAHAVLAQREEIARHQLLERRGGPLAADFELAHVADVEQAGALARPAVLGHDAFELHGHGIARERHHAAAQLAVQAIQRQCERGFIGMGHRGSVRDTDSRRKAAPGRPHLSRNLRVSRETSPCLPRRWDAPEAASAFQSAVQGGRAVRWPERFRGRLLLRRRGPKAANSPARHRCRSTDGTVSMRGGRDSVNGR